MRPTWSSSDERSRRWNKTANSIAQHLEYVVADLNASLEEQYQAVFGLLEHDRKDRADARMPLRRNSGVSALRMSCRTAAEHDKAGAGRAE